MEFQALKTKPDFEHLANVLTRRTTDGPVPIIELFADIEIMSAVTGTDFPAEQYYNLTSKGGDITPEMLQLGIRLLDMIIDFSMKIGYDYAFTTPLMPEFKVLQTAGAPEHGTTYRRWEQEHAAVITDRASFEEFLWPSMDLVSILPVEYMADKCPAGMKIIAWLPGGIFEQMKQLMGFEAMAVKSIEEPDLVDAILEKVLAYSMRAMEMAASHDAVGAVFYPDDLGFNTGPFLNPSFTRKYLVPKYKKLAEACHARGKPFLLHSCGNIYSIMDDLIDIVGIDGKHSYEDSIRPVEDVYREYRHRMCILGGLDMDILARGTEEETRRRTRHILETCGRDGSFCMGTGNSVANYCRIENYLAMIDETRRWNEGRGYK
jgi:uroporphyrinogen decarboxylase